MSEEKKEEKVYTPPPRKTIPDDQGELWGHDLYPERRKLKQKSVVNTLMMKEGKEELDRYHCEKLVYKCVKKREYKLNFLLIILCITNPSLFFRSTCSINDSSFESFWLVSPKINCIFNNNKI